MQGAGERRADEERRNTQCEEHVPFGQARDACRERTPHEQSEPEADCHPAYGDASRAGQGKTKEVAATRADGAAQPQLV
jgi:hypothetical protein